MKRVRLQIDDLIKEANLETEQDGREIKLHSAEQLVNLHSTSLSRHVVSAYQRSIKDCRQRQRGACDGGENTSVSFGFHRAANGTKPAKVIEKLPTVKADDELHAQPTNSAETDCEVVRDQHDRTIILDDEASCTRGLHFVNVERCKIYITAPKIALLVANNMRECVLVSLPVETSVFLTDCYDCTVAVACHQLRIKSSSGLRLFADVRSRSAVIECCSNIAFGPYSVDCGPRCDRSVPSSSDDKLRVDDFSNPCSDLSSCNWSHIPVDECQSFTLPTA